MIKEAYKSYRMIGNVKMPFRVMRRFRVRAIEYTVMYIVIFTVLFSFVLFAIYFFSVKYLFLFCLTESE